MTNQPSRVGSVPALPQLDAEEQRILGVLLEKQVTVPASYPMTLAAVRTGCNQSSSRDPIVDYDEPTVEATLRGLKDRQLVRIVWADRGRRTLKYHQLLSEVLELNDAEKALVTVLLLRGAQAPGELRTRTDRLHGFADRGEVEVVLADLAARPEPLVRELPRQRGQHDNRWVHLLGDVAGGRCRRPGAAPAWTASRCWPHGAEARDQRVRSSYDAVATGVRRPPGRRALGPAVRELAPGPGRRARGRRPGGRGGLRPGPRHGVPRRGRRRRFRHRPLAGRWSRRHGGGSRTGTTEVGDLRQLMRPTSAPGWTAVLAWYSLIHLAASELPDALAALDPAVAPRRAGSSSALHAGAEVRHLDELVRRARRPRLRPARPGRGGAPGRAAGTDRRRVVPPRPDHPPVARPPSGSTSWAASRPDARPVLVDVRLRPRHPDAPARARLPRGRARRPVGHGGAGDAAGDRVRHRGGRLGCQRCRGGGAPGSGA